MQLFQEGTTSTLFLVGLVMVVAAVLFRAQWRGRRRGQVEPATWPAPPVRAGQAARPREADDWRVELHELARETSARLDAKMAALEQLIRDARRESTRLESLLADVEHRPATFNGARPAASLSPDARPHNQAEALSAARELLARAPVEGNAGNAPRRHDDVYALADAGLDSFAIAERLAAPIGEVELILGLRNSR